MGFGSANRYVFGEVLNIVNDGNIFTKISIPHLIMTCNLEFYHLSDQYFYIVYQGER